MNLYNHMAVFASIAEAGSITRAARHLGLPKSTVSHKLKELEDHLGAVLVHRTTRRLSLTEQGQDFFLSCKEMVRIGDNATRMLTDSNIEPSGDLVIGCPYAMSDSILPRLIAAYLARYPRVNIRIIASNDRLDLLDHSIDIAFRFGSLEDSASLITRRVQNLDRKLLASPGYLASAGPLNQPADLKDHQCILSSNTPVWSFVTGPQISPVKRIQVNDLILARSLAIENAGICLLPEILARHAAGQGDLVEVLPGFPVTPGPLAMIYLRHAVGNIAIRRFIDLFQEIDKPVDRRNG